MVILLDAARLTDVVRTLFALSIADATVSRLLVRRLAAAAPPPDVPPQVVASAPFASFVLAPETADAAFAAACRELRAEHDRVLAAAGKIGEPEGLTRAVALLDDPAFVLPPIDALFVDESVCPSGVRRTFVTRLAERARVDVEWHASCATAAAPATLDAVVAALRWAATADDAEARRLLSSPFSGVPSVDARALIVAAGTRLTVGDAIAAQRPALGEHAREAAFRFVAALEKIRGAYRAQGTRAGELVAAIAGALDLGAADTTLFAEIARIARALDEIDALTGTLWEMDELVAALDEELDVRIAERTPGEREAPATAAPMPERALPPRRGHFSASSLNTFAECRRKWFYRYLCSAVEDKGSSASFYGTAFHSALEAFHERFPHIAELDARTVQTHLEACITSAFDRYRDAFESNVEFELQRRRAIRTVRKYGQWLVSRSKEEPFTVVGCEISTELLLDGFDFVGFIDRLDRDDRTGAMSVVDYKTGSIATSAQEYREKVLKFADFQLPFYYWARTEAGDRVTRLVLLPLKEATADVLPIELEVVPVPRKESGRKFERGIAGTISIDELRTARAKMVEMCAEISSGTIAHFAAAEDPQACRYCAYRAGCRERPAPNEDRFGR